MKSKTIKIKDCGTIQMLRCGGSETIMSAVGFDGDMVMLYLPLKKLRKLGDTCRQMAGEIESDKEQP